MAAAQTEGRVERDGDAVLRVSGALTFATAARLWIDGERALARCTGSHVDIDCSGVTAADSAGLAVLVQWLASGQRGGRTVALRALPRAVVEIARISELEDLIQPGG